MAAYQGLIAFGPDANCTLDLCPVSETVYKYRPSLAASAVFLTLFAISLLLHAFQGVKYRTYWFSGAMVLGCISEVLGYGGRIMLYQNPFGFTGFILQITTIAFGPAFFSAAVYFTLAKIVRYVGVQHSRFRPSLFYWIFIPCDLVSLALQGTGGGLSTSSSGSSQIGVDVALAGLGFQVFTLTIFIGLAVDYAVRYTSYRRANSAEAQATPLSTRFFVFVAFLSAAIVLILIRCAYRIDELSQGYSGPLISDEGLFIALEGVMSLLACYALNVSNPGPVFDNAAKPVVDEKRLGSDIESR